MKGQEVINYMGQRKMPDIEEVRQNCHEHFMAQITDENLKHNAKRAGRFVPLVAVLAVLFTMTVTVFSLGGIDWISERLNPTPFVAIAEPVGVSAEDQGIVTTMIGAKRIGGMAVIYLSLHDETGQNRITENTRFFPHFASGVIGENYLNVELLYFDKTSNTAYFEILLGASMIVNPLRLHVSGIAFDKREYKHVPIDLPLANLAIPEMILIAQCNMGMTLGRAFAGERLGQQAPWPEEVMLPGYIAPISTYFDDMWISNIGLVDGKLHIQTMQTIQPEGYFDNPFAPRPFLSLMNPQGDIVDFLFGVTISTDENFVQLIENEPFERRTQNKPVNQLIENVYSYTDVDVNNLENYTLVTTTIVRSNGINGTWIIEALVEESPDKIISISNDMWINGHHVENVTLSPFGLRLTGRSSIEAVLDFYESKMTIPLWLSKQFTIYLETADSYVSITSGRLGAQVVGVSGYFGGFYRNDNTFNLIWMADAPIDVQEVTAIIINGYRIPVGN